MKSTLFQISEKYNLIDRTIKNAQKYFQNWYENNPKELKGYVASWKAHKELDMEFPESSFQVVKIGYDVRLDQENLELVSVVVHLLSRDESWVCTYYCYYDMNGEYVDDFVDR